jgi:hypothetical protein
MNIANVSTKYPSHLQIVDELYKVASKSFNPNVNV